ncbi:nucleotidyltransferase domain-containing protein [Paenibacillus sp. M1]|uniref:Nucleotidyltransferase domain-containing protein n=1 Tax=Paenibacillus haidiansis TaxID=1574488 RepID=A0ABU7VV23_9BACL
MSKPQLSEELEMGLKALLYAHPEIKRLVLFGSRAKGKARNNSDIDLYVDAGEDSLTIREDVADSTGIVPADVIVPEMLDNSPVLREQIEEHGIDLVKYFGYCK